MPYRRAAVVGLVILALALPLLVSGNRFYAFILGVTYLYILWSSGMNLLSGFTGLMPLMYAGLAGIGAYTTVNLVMKFDVSFWLAMPRPWWAWSLAFHRCGFGVSTSPSPAS